MRLVLFWSRGGAVEAAYTCMQEEQQQEEEQEELGCCLERRGSSSPLPLASLFLCF